MCNRVRGRFPETVQTRRRGVREQATKTRSAQLDICDALDQAAATDDRPVAVDMVAVERDRARRRCRVRAGSRGSCSADGTDG